MHYKEAGVGKCGKYEELDFPEIFSKYKQRRKSKCDSNFFN